MHNNNKITRTICNSVRRVAGALNTISEKLDERCGIDEFIIGMPVCSIPPSTGHPYRESLYVDHGHAGKCRGCFICVEKQCGEDGEHSREKIPVNGDVDKLRDFYARLQQDHGYQFEICDDGEQPMFVYW